MNAINTPNKSLFLSYSRRQTTWCDELYTAIDTDTYFQRWRDNKIPESADWWDSICVNIEGCFAFVAMISQDYLDSVYCMGELEYAIKLNKPIIALMLQDVDYPQKLSEQRLQFARVDGLAMPEVINKVLNACTQITLAYVQDEFSTDIHPRKHLRPSVPLANPSTHSSDEDLFLSKRIYEISKKPLGRNDLCWCGSGKKYKHCHYREDRDNENSANEIGRDRVEKRNHDEQEDVPLSQRIQRKSLDIMPAPFDWIKIPYENYSIAKYPITNAQFRKFIEANGYTTDKWWTKDGLEYRNDENWTQPRYWADSELNGDNQPIVGVSWFEAMAFCSWLSDATGEQITLPTEEEWQFAARGTDGRIYPWGDVWDSRKCNNNVKESMFGFLQNKPEGHGKRTTSVQAYELTGKSPFGVADMVGNACEWCLSEYTSEYTSEPDEWNNTLDISRILRGGILGSDKLSSFHITRRLIHPPYDRLSFFGFRISRSH